MKSRFNFLLTAVFVSAITVALAPAVHASSSSYNVPCLNSVNSPKCHVHMVAAASGQQYSPSALAADEMANANSLPGQCSFHWTGRLSGQLIDERSSEFEPGNVWIVWIADQDGGNCAASLGNNHITDVWVGISVDSVVAMRGFFASQVTGKVGGSVYVTPDPASNLITAGVWADGRPDVQIYNGGASNIPLAIGDDDGGFNDVYINAGLTDIRPEDTLVATDRALDTLNSTLTGLGYGPEPVGTPILTSQGTGTRALPIAFTLIGNDPITNLPVRPFLAIPVGAGEMMFMYNNNNASPSPVRNLMTGVGGTGTNRFLASYLFGGGLNGVHCTTDSSAFGGINDGTGTPLKLYLREPLSATMSTAEFNVFRTSGNTSGSQETGVGGPAHNPLDGLACASDVGARYRVIGNGEAISAVINNAYGLAYHYFNFSNLARYSGSTKYNYLTVDGIDPLGGELANAAQTPPNCLGPCTTALWGGGPSFPNLRNGTYGAWSLYRWVVEDANDYGDPFGPAHLAQVSQDIVDSTMADFVPFCSTIAGDSLNLYRSHSNIVHDSWVPAITGNNGAVSACGDSLGLGTEAGSDVGGLILGPFPATGTVNVSSSTKKATYESGQKFTTWAYTTSAVGNTATIDGNVCTITGSVTATSMPISLGGACNPRIGINVTYSYTPQPPGVIKKTR
jgi:hypothetical protein